jgi:hypothetical protein
MAADRLKIGEDAPGFEDQAQVRRILGPLLRHIELGERCALHQAPGQYETPHMNRC